MAKVSRTSSKPLLSDDTPLRSRARIARDPKQPSLPIDPMPERIEPCLALLKSKAPEGQVWLYEVKWDGYRIAVHVGLNDVKILTRGGHDWTDRFPSIAEAARSFGTTMIFDGEAVVLDEQGRSDFGALQQALGGRGGKRRATEAVMVAFDLLYIDGHDISEMELVSRRHLLQDLIGEGDGAIKLSGAVDGDGAALLTAAREHGLEGIIAKHKDAPYRSGRTGDWLKIKCIQGDSFLIVGYEPSDASPGGIGRLLVAAYESDNLVYVGSVGTGFKAAPTRKLMADLDRLKIRKPPIAIKEKGVVWVEPTLIAEIEYRAWTDDRKLRHAAYKGLREHQDNAAVYVLK